MEACLSSANGNRENEIQASKASHMEKMEIKLNIYIYLLLPITSANTFNISLSNTSVKSILYHNWVFSSVLEAPF